MQSKTHTVFDYLNMGIMGLNPIFGLEFFFVMFMYVNACASVQADMPNI